MRMIATTRKIGEYWYSAIVLGEYVKIFKDTPFTNRQIAFKHASFEVYERNNYNGWNKN